MTSNPTQSAPLTAIALTCSLKPSPAESSTNLLTRQLLDQLEQHGVTGDLVRAVDHDIKPGVEADMGEGDAWPALRERILAADIFILATPTWLGEMSSVARHILERLDAELSYIDDQGKLLTYGKVAGVCVVGNEDGAHAITASAYQGLSDVGFTIPAGGVTYWNGEAMHGVDYKDLDETPEVTATTTATLAAKPRTWPGCCARRPTPRPEPAPSPGTRVTGCAVGQPGNSWVSARSAAGRRAL